MSLDDPEVVRAEYASEAGLVARALVYQGIAGPDARETAFRAVADGNPARVLEVGCGWGDQDSTLLLRDTRPGRLGERLTVGGDAFEVEGDRGAHVRDAFVECAPDARAAWKVGRPRGIVRRRAALDEDEIRPGEIWIVGRFCLRDMKGEEPQEAVFAALAACRPRRVL